MEYAIGLLSDICVLKKHNIGMVEKLGTAKGAISGKSGSTGFFRYHASY